MSIYTLTFKYLEENIAALKINLSPEDVSEVRDIVDRANVYNGDRYPQGMMEYVFNFADTPPLSST